MRNHNKNTKKLNTQPELDTQETVINFREHQAIEEEMKVVAKELNFAAASFKLLKTEIIWWNLL